MKRRRPSISHEKEQIREFRKHPDRARAYLSACMEVAFEKSDPSLVLVAVALVAKAYGLTRLARKTHLQRESLHRMFSRRGNPEWNSLFRVFKALHIQPRLEQGILS